MNDTLEVAKNAAQTIGISAAPIALTTDNSGVQIVTIISSIIILLPKAVELFKSIKNLFKKKTNVRN